MRVYDLGNGMVDVWQEGKPPVRMVRVQAERLGLVPPIDPRPGLEALGWTFDEETRVATPPKRDE
jgi:hypothetical protein